jgi:hypothetical protein
MPAAADVSSAKNELPERPSQIRRREAGHGHQASHKQAASEQNSSHHTYE